MAEFFAPKRGESVIDEDGFMTRRFSEYLEVNTDTTTNNTTDLVTVTTDIAANKANIATNTTDITNNTTDITTVTTDLTNHESASDPHTGYYLADGTRAMSGDLEHTGSNVGFYGSTVTPRPAAYTQTYSTTTRTHSNLTSSTLTDSTGGTPNTTVVAVSGTGDDATVNDNFADLTAQINSLRADLINVKDILNQVIDDDQLQGLKQ